MEKLIKYFKRNSYATMKELRVNGFQTRDIRALTEKGFIDKIKPGFYKLSELDIENSGIIDVCKSIPQGIICLISALEYYELSTVNPWQIYVAIPHSERKIKINYPPVQFFYFRDRFYHPGIVKIQTKHGIIRIYNPEKTICDMFRYRNKLGEDLALEGLKNYLKRKDADIAKLHEYAIQCKVKTVMLPYLKAMVIE